MLEAKEVACGYYGKSVLENVSFTVKAGQVLCLLGPNGSGKTTLFKTLLGLNKPITGSILFENQDLSGWSMQKRAKVIGYIPQSNNLSFPFLVREVVLMGRTAHIGIFGTPSPSDCLVAEEALDRLNISHLRDKVFTQLSGGERQMVLVARALAQEPRVLIMDEPTSSLDFSNQYVVLDRVCKLAGQGMTVIMSSHHPGHAFLHATHVMLLKKGGVMRFGSPEEVLTETNLREVYGINVKIACTGDSSDFRSRVCIPVPG